MINAIKQIIAPALVKPQVINSRIPARALPVLPVQHPTVSNSVPAAVKPFGGRSK